MVVQLTQEQKDAGWQVKKLGEIFEVKHGFAFKGENFSEDISLPIVVTPGNFAIGGGYKEAKPKNYVGEYPAEYQFGPGDFMVTMTDLSKMGDTLGNPAKVPADGRSYLHNQRIGKVIFHGNDVNTDFIFFRMMCSDYRQHVLSTASGSTVRHTSPNKIKEFEFLLPPLNEQKRVAEILGSMDDKIEANSRLLDSLSELGSALMTREISESSTTVLLSEIAEITMGQSPSGDSLNEDSEGVVFYQGRRDFGFRYPAERVYTTAPTRMAEEGDILLSVRAPVGDLNRIDKACCIGRGVAAIRAKEGNTSQLFYLLKESPQLWEPFEGEGTIFSSINRKQLHELSVPLVSQCTEYENIEENIRSLTIENNKLAETRDRLIRYLIG